VFTFNPINPFYIKQVLILMIISGLDTASKMFDHCMKFGEPGQAFASSIRQSAHGGRGVDRLFSGWILFFSKNPK